MVEMRQRIDRADSEREISETIQVRMNRIEFNLYIRQADFDSQAMCDIAKDRARKLQVRI
jgi:hypothetical protein